MTPGPSATEIGTEPAAPSETAHAFLRRVTRPLHDGVEAAFEEFDLQTVEGLSGFLLRQACALLPLERAIEEAGVDHLLPDWPQRRRAPHIAADLAALGLAVPEPPAMPRLQNPIQTLGMLYVLEGSKLGGRVLHRRALSSSDPRVRATDAFLGHTHHRGWVSFLAVLDAVAPEPGAWVSLRDGAEVAFASFRRAAEGVERSGFAQQTAQLGLYHQAQA